MSKIIFYLVPDNNIKEYLMPIKKNTGYSLSDLKKKLESGAPIAEFILYENDHDEIAEKIINLITAISKKNGQVNIYELDIETQDISESCDETTKISTEHLLNLLDEFNMERTTQSSFSFREF